MSNQKGNQFPAWGINTENQVFAVDTSNNLIMKSEPGFAIDLGISEDGTLWALSQIPDPDGGGAKIFWSNGDGSWNEINTSDPGGVQITGTSAGSCIYRTFDGILRTMDTAGNGSVLYDQFPVIDVNYGGGYLWAILDTNTIIDNVLIKPHLHFSKFPSPLNWKAFDGYPTPRSLSTAYSGNCYGLEDGSPVYFSTDGSGTGSAGAGVNGQCLQITFKSWTYVLTTDLSEEGNLVYKWRDTYGGKFEPTNIRANYFLASYYRSLPA